EHRIWWALGLGGLDGVGGVTSQYLPAQRLLERSPQDPVHVINRPRGKPAFAVKAAAGERLGIGGADVSRLQLRERQAAQQRHDILAAQLGIALERSGRDLSVHVLEPALEEGGDRHAGGIDRGAGLQLGDEAGALGLRLARGADEAVPAALALAGGVLRVDDDRPMSRRTLPGMALTTHPPFFPETSHSTRLVCLPATKRHDCVASPSLKPEAARNTPIPLDRLLASSREAAAGCFRSRR